MRRHGPAVSSQAVRGNDWWFGNVIVREQGMSSDSSTEHWQPIPRSAFEKFYEQKSRNFRQKS